MATLSEELAEHYEGSLITMQVFSADLYWLSDGKVPGLFYALVSSSAKCED